MIVSETERHALSMQVLFVWPVLRWFNDSFLIADVYIVSTEYKSDDKVYVD